MRRIFFSVFALVLFFVESIIISNNSNYFNLIREIPDIRKLDI